MANPYRPNPSLRFPLTGDQVKGLDDTLEDIYGELRRILTDAGVVSGDLATHAALTNPHSSTALNTASRIVLRDASGNFAAGTITADLTGTASGNQPLSTFLTDIVALTPTDSNIIVGNGTTWVAESGATARTSMGLGTTDAVQFSSLGIPMPTPAAPSLGVDGAGTLTSGTYPVAVVAVDRAGGVTLASPVVLQAVNGTTENRINVTIAAVTTATRYRVYVGPAGASVPDRYFTTQELVYAISSLSGATVAALPASATAYSANLTTDVLQLGKHLTFDDTPGNVYAGYNAGLYMTTGIQDTAFGYRALERNTTGNYNTAIGWQALLSNVGGAAGAGSANTAIGAGALRLNTTGKVNIAIGAAALGANTIGVYNCAIGTESMNVATTAAYNTVVSAYDGMYSLTTGEANTAVGYAVMYSITTGIRNVAMGESTLYLNSTGNNNTAIGRVALYAVTGSGNIGLGAFAGRHETGSNRLYVDDRLRADNATERTNAILYGVMADAPADQTLAINANLTVSQALSGTSATLSGNLAVDTSVLFVDAASDRVGIGTASPSNKLHILTSDTIPLQLEGSAAGGVVLDFKATADDGQLYRLQSTANASGFGGGKFVIHDGTNGRFLIDSAGVVTIPGVTTLSAGVVVSTGGVELPSSVPGTTTNKLYSSAGSLFWNGSLVGTGAGSGDVVGPASATDNGFAKFNGTTGKLLKNSAATIALGSEVSGDLPFANLVQASAASVLLGRGSAGGAGDYQEITLDGLTMTGTVLSAAGGGGSYTKIEEQTPTGTSVTFSSLGSYTHLEIRYSARGDTALTSVELRLTFNGDTAANYDYEYLTGVGSAASATETLAQTFIQVSAVAAASASAGLPSAGTVSVYDYAGTTFQKHVTASLVLRRSTATGNTFIRHYGGGWRSTSAITSITLTLAAGNFVAGSKFTLYGLE